MYRIIQSTDVFVDVFGSRFLAFSPLNVVYLEAFNVAFPPALRASA